MSRGGWSEKETFMWSLEWMNYDALIFCFFFCHVVMLGINVVILMRPAVAIF